MVVKGRNPLTFWVASIFFGWFLSMLGYMIFLSKYGGYYYGINQILYIFDNIRVFFLYFSISINWISRMLSVGRSIFIWGLIGLSLFLTTHDTKRKKFIFTINLMVCATNILVYEPAFYRQLLYLLQQRLIYFISVFIRTWVLLAFFYTFYCLARKYQRLHLQFIKRQIKYITLCVFALSSFYFYLIFMGPIQLTDIRTYYFLYANFTNFNPPLSIFQWVVFIGFTGVTSVLSIFAIWKYSDVAKRLDTLDLFHEQKFLSVNNGVSVITHSLKNQLLMIDVLTNKIGEGIHKGDLKDHTKVDDVARDLEKISAVTQQTLQRIIRLYKAFKSISLDLKPRRFEEIIEKSLAHIECFPENIRIEKNIHDHLTILADFFYLTEAISNILINAVEAIGAKPDGRVGISLHLEGGWCVLEIEDNGIGISKNEIEKIFDPFYSQKMTTQNWGIGLSYAKQIIKSHFGYIQVKSQIQKGSTFSIVLPAIDADSDTIRKRDE
jgi:signal transduction histidine kinase